ncbi:hypothetical protein [Bdellovibrio reynosensis]|uniref:Uncharacterized protein n=1 Tax=Bdellovibrio reynosensis TaxID=2835041 RepID=A0ABY4C9A8_9BACT|nr:hypothetical protein [Bdellovibrio reynosensis]UOF01369.1 hypothetical protein MNR06_00175 [Bdellovibrio reynosensis]
MKLVFSLLFSLSILGCQHIPRSPASEETQLRPLSIHETPNGIANRHALLVVHATTEFDTTKTAAAGIDQLVQDFKSQGRPVIYLVSDQSEKGNSRWYTADRSPDFAIFSEGGEHNLPIRANEVTVAGGFFGSTDTLNGCQTLAVKDAIRMHFESSEEPFTVHIPLKATYTYTEWEAFRQEMLNTGKLNLDVFALAKYPFASVFFLREGNDGAGDDGNEQNFAHSYNGNENQSYRRGEEVSRDKYQFRFYINDRLIESVSGPGKRIVNIKLETR